MGHESFDANLERAIELVRGDLARLCNDDSTPDERALRAFDRLRQAAEEMDRVYGTEAARQAHRRLFVDLTQRLGWPNGQDTTLTPELIAWARQQCDEEEMLAGIREIQAGGGHELSEFLHELEAAAGPDE